jgi:hypothetical protein
MWSVIAAEEQLLAVGDDEADPADYGKENLDIWVCRFFGIEEPDDRAEYRGKQHEAASDPCDAPDPLVERRFFRERDVGPIWLLAFVRLVGFERGLGRLGLQEGPLTSFVVRSWWVELRGCAWSS